MPYDNIIISEQPLFRIISERRQSRKAFVENPVEIRNNTRCCNLFPYCWKYLHHLMPLDVIREGEVEGESQKTCLNQTIFIVFGDQEQ